MIEPVECAGRIIVRQSENQETRFKEPKMIRPLLRLKRRRVLINVDIQKDLFTATGKACVRNHRRVLTNIRRICAWARKQNIKVITTAIAYSNGHHDRHPYCKDGSEGARIISYAMRNRFIRYEADGYSDLPRNVFLDHDQVILEKKTANPFDEPRAERMLTELAVDEIIVVGAIAEDSVFDTVMGLLQRGKKVSVVVDAVGGSNKEAAEMAIKKMAAKGAKLIEAKDLVVPGHLKHVNACGCERCKAAMAVGA